MENETKRSIPEELNKPRGDVADDICSEVLQMRSVERRHKRSDAVTNDCQLGGFIQLSEARLSDNAHTRAHMHTMTRVTTLFQQ